MEEQKTVMQPNQDGNTGKNNRLYLALAVVLAIILIAKFYLDYQDKKELEVYYQGELDLADQKLAEISLELDEKIREIDSLGGTVGDLQQVKIELEAERDQLQRNRTANRQIIQRLRAKTEGYEELLKVKDKEIEQLKSLNEELLSENTVLKTEKNQLSRSISELNEDRQQLEQKVQIASRLVAENIEVSALARNGKERVGSFRQRHLARLKVKFSIAENNVAPIQTKDILIQIKDPNGQVIFDVAKGSGTFIRGGKEEFYTLAQTIVFDNSGQELTFIYDKGSDYEKGDYRVDVVTDGYDMGTVSFTVR